MYRTTRTEENPMLTCRRCGQEFARLTTGQTRCPRCEREVCDLVRIDADRRARRTFTAKELTQW